MILPVPGYFLYPRSTVNTQGSKRTFRETRYDDVQTVDKTTFFKASSSFTGEQRQGENDVHVRLREKERRRDPK